MNHVAYARVLLYRPNTMPNIPVNDTVVHAFAQLVDDSGNSGSYREPSHSDIEFQVNASGLTTFDPKQQGQLMHT